MNKIEIRKTHENASTLWNSDGAFKDNFDNVDDVDNNDNIVDTEDIVNTTCELNFSITYCSYSVLLTRSMISCFIDDVDEDKKWSVNFTFDAIFTSFIILKINKRSEILMDQGKAQIS